MTLQPSETEQALVWLENFNPEEQHAAELLVNSLRFMSSTTFRSSLSALLANLKEQVSKPLAIYPIRELPKGITSASYAAEAQMRQEPLPDGPFGAVLPLDQPFEPLPGSEGVVGNIIREAIGHRPDRAIACSPKTLRELRQAKPRTIVLVDDYSGTGSRVKQYVDSWMSHPTIRSWYSYKLIEFHVALVAVSGDAIIGLEKHRRIKSIHYCEQAPDFNTAMWSAEERQDIEQLCVKYSHIPGFELGFNEARGLFILQHTVPNNLPAILWQRSGKHRPNWKPLFASRRLSPQLQHDLGDYKLELNATDIANSMQQFRLGSALANQPNPTVRMILLVLGAAAKKIRDPRQLSVLLRTPLASARQIQLACQRLELMDSDGRLTDLGRAELRHARTRGDDVHRRQLRGSEDAYYPLQLRGAGEI